MAYFLPLQRKRIESNLSRIIQRDKKVKYLEIQKDIADAEIKCLDEIIWKPFTFKKRLEGKCEDIFENIVTYKIFLKEKLRYMFPQIVITFFGVFIQKLAVMRYVYLLKNEKIRLIEFIIDKKMEIENEKQIDNKQLSLRLEDPKEDQEVEIFEGPGRKELQNIHTATTLKLYDLRMGFGQLRKTITNLKDRDKVIFLNDIKKDLLRIIDQLDIDDNVLKEFSVNYRLLKKDNPEIIHLVMREYQLLQIEKRKEGGSNIIYVVDIKERLKLLNVIVLQFLERVEEEIKLLESKRIIKRERKTKDDETIEKKGVIWIGSKDQLLTLFYKLNEIGFVPFYDEDFILGHFTIIGSDGKTIKGKAIYPKSQFFWVGTDDDFAQLINELVENGLSPKGNKYKKFSEHFINKNHESFRYLPQKQYFANTYLQLNEKISEIVTEIKNM